MKLTNKKGIMKLQYIKADGIYYRTDANKHWPYSSYEIIHWCEITPLPDFGAFKIKFYDERLFFEVNGYVNAGMPQPPNCSIIVYPAGISEIKYVNLEKESGN